MLTLSPVSGVRDSEFYTSVDEFGNHIRSSLRKSDIFMRNGKNQYFVFLTDIRADSIDKVITHLVKDWDFASASNIIITHEKEFIGSKQEPVSANKAKKVVVVDDDVINLQVAGKILSTGGLRVAALKSGDALFDYLAKETELPNLILMDVKMPGMSGFDCIKKLHSLDGMASKIPVIFLTADESEGTEKEGLKLGAMDFIRKPFVPEVLLLRVKNLIELVTLQSQLYFEVEQKTRENRDLFMQIVTSLAAAIDTKDVYTKGHSSRVAEYARMIAKRSGYTDVRQDEIYVLALLHDVGKIGIPDGILNKPGTLTSEEYELIKAHSAMGASILKNIEDKFESCAMYHHERYDGTGYPKGIKGNDIPEEARIIAVADAYDAMSSDRSYRAHLSQEAIKSELELGMGTQFDPKFAEIMLTIVEEDKEYRLRG